MKRHRQLALEFRSWGGRRRGAGRKPSPGRGAVPHRRRGAHNRHLPVHVTLRASRVVPSLRARRVFGAVRLTLAAASSLDRFRVVHFSVQADHVHLLVEADSHQALTRGVQGMAIRLARAVNRVLGRRGAVWGDRFHARELRTQREVRNALVYILNNWRKHVRGAHGLDGCSSARWFSGWRTGPGTDDRMPPVVTAETWLVRIGWRRHGAIDVDEIPRMARPPVRSGP